MNQKIALVTGASKGIGAAIAKQMGIDRYTVLLHYNNSIKSVNLLKKELESKKIKCEIIKADLTIDKDIKNLFKYVQKKYGYINLLINNAGFDYGYLFEEYKVEEIRHVINIILVSKILATKYAIPLLKKGKSPSIINISSRMGKETNYFRYLNLWSISSWSY